MADVTIDLEILCDDCGLNFEKSMFVNGGTIYITPCPHCLDEAFAEGSREGHAEGYADCESDNNL